MYTLEQKYSPFIERVLLTAKPQEKFAEIVSQCCSDYQASAKGVYNLSVLNELLRKLFTKIFLRFQELNT